jgi:hypothetical protein
LPKERTSSFFLFPVTNVIRGFVAAMVEKLTPLLTTIRPNRCIAMPLCCVLVTMPHTHCVRTRQTYLTETRRRVDGPTDRNCDMPRGYLPAATVKLHRTAARPLYTQDLGA